MVSFFKAVFVFLWSPYRRRVRNSLAWRSCIHAVNHLMGHNADKSDIEAARIINNSAKVLLKEL